MTIVEFLDRMVPLEDEEVSAELAKRYQQLGIDVLTSTRVESIDDSGAAGPGHRHRQGRRSSRSSRPTRCCRRSASSRASTATAWRRPASRSPSAARSTIDGRCRTNVPHIFAIGDVTAKLMLAHAAEAMGVIAAETIAGAETMELDYVMIPRATFCQPQIASFGYTEAQAREQGFDVKVAKFPFTANGKAHGLGDPTGFVKMISDAKYGELLGAPPDRPRGHRAAARADPGPAVGPDRPRGGPQRARPPDPGRGGQGGDPRPGRPHDQHVSRGRRGDQ